MDETNRDNIKKLMPCLLILFILANLMVQAFVTVSPAIADEFKISASTVSLVVTISTIMLGVCSVIYGTLSDFIPVRKLLIFGMGMFVLGTVMGLVFQKIFFMIVVARAVQTVGQAAMSSLYLVIASRYSEGKEKIKYFAYFTASFQIAQALGVLAGGLIATYINWKMLFAISLISILFIPVIFRYAPREETGTVKKVDYVGMLLFSAMIVLLTLLFNQFTAGLLIAEILVTVLFMIYITKSSSAFITPIFFKKNKRYTLVISIVFVVYLSQFVFAFLYTFIVKELYGNALDLVSYILLPGYITAAAVGAMSDKTILKLGLFRTITLGITLIITALLITGVFMGQGKILLSITAIIFFAGHNTLYSSMIDTVAESLPKAEVGRGIGLNDLIINVSSSLGVAIGGKLMVTQGLNNIKFLPLNGQMNLYGNIMIIFAIIAIIGLVLFRKNMKSYY